MRILLVLADNEISDKTWKNAITVGPRQFKLGYFEFTLFPNETLFLGLTLVFLATDYDGYFDLGYRTGISSPRYFELIFFSLRSLK